MQLGLLKRCGKEPVVIVGIGFKDGKPIVGDTLTLQPSTPCLTIGSFPFKDVNLYPDPGFMTKYVVTILLNSDDKMILGWIFDYELEIITDVSCKT